MVLLFLNDVVLHLDDDPHVQLWDVLLDIVLLDVAKLPSALLLMESAVVVFYR